MGSRGPGRLSGTTTDPGDLPALSNATLPDDDDSPRYECAHQRSHFLPCSQGCHDVPAGPVFIPSPGLSGPGTGTADADRITYQASVFSARADAYMAASEAASEAYRAASDKAWLDFRRAMASADAEYQYSLWVAFQRSHGKGESGD